MSLSFGDVLWRQVDKKLPEDESEGKKVQKSWAIDVYLGYGMVYSLENKKGFIKKIHNKYQVSYRIHPLYSLCKQRIDGRYFIQKINSHKLGN